MADQTTLSPPQLAKIGRLLRNESDVAYKRRVHTMFSYLELEPGQTILDCGTGMGFYLKAASTLFPDLRLHGIDYEPKALGFAQEHLSDCMALLLRGDIHRLPYADASFDRVVMSEVLEHLVDDRLGLSEVRRVLKPGGILAVTVPHRHYPYWYDPINRLAEGVFRRPIRSGPFAGIWANHERLYDRDEVVGLIRGNGFCIADARELTHYCFPGTQTIVYTFGKGLIDHNLLPAFIAQSTHRFQGEENKNSPLNPINWVLGLFNWVDSWNERPGALDGKHTFVNISIKAVKVGA